MRRQSIRVPIEYEGLIQKIRLAPVGYRVDIVPRVTAKALAPRISPIGSFYQNRGLNESIFIKDVNFNMRKGSRYLLLEV